MINPIKSNEKYPFALPNLPYPQNALEPHITDKTLSFHHGKHHNAYVVNLNNLIKDTPLAEKTLEEIILAVAGDESKVAIFNNAAQVWNHTFYWSCMQNSGGGSFETMIEQFKAAAMGQFGSGWAWLVLENDKLKIVKTANANLPMTNKQLALLTIDVWEHAYYLDYQNLRAKYVDVFFANLVNWGFAQRNFEG
jgi:Fe-Mn family superoxide dismutase